MMNILMTGATGLVGTALVKTLTGEGHMIYRLMRPGSKARKTIAPRVFERSWNSASGEIDGAVGTGESQAPGDMDAVINLAGASIAGGRWTSQRKTLLRSSRIDTTRGLVSAIAKMSKRPRVLISASAIGYYGDRGDELLTENSNAGRGFLAEVAKEWETEAMKAEAFGIRVVRARFGIILAKDGGALRQMMLPFKFGVGGKLGSGRQWMSWITLEDVVAILRRTLQDDALRGAVAVVAPEPVRNVEFTRWLAKAMHRPAIFTAPAFALRLAMGEMADALLLEGQRVVPQKLQQQGYQFLHPNLSEALSATLRPSVNGGANIGM
jgi:uncharacterized protein (TIGR01777 family)